MMIRNSRARTSLKYPGNNLIKEIFHMTCECISHLIDFRNTWLQNNQEALKVMHVTYISHKTLKLERVLLILDPVPLNIYCT